MSRANAPGRCLLPFSADLKVVSIVPMRPALRSQGSKHAPHAFARVFSNFMGVDPAKSL